MPPEPHDSPMTGGSENTPAGDAANPSGSNGSAPSSQTPTPDLGRALEARFKAGYGKGADKGRAEGQQAVLDAAGFASVDDLLSHLEESRGSAEDASPVDVKTTPEYRDAQRSLAKQSRALEEAAERMKVLEARADEARLDKLRAIALSKGVGEGGQLEAFVQMFSSQVRFDDSLALEVVEHVNGEAIPSGKTLDAWADEVLASNRFLLAPEKSRGGGSRVEPVEGNAGKPGPDYDLWGVPPPKE